MNNTGRYKPYPAYKDSGVEWLGEVPEGWKVTKLGYYASVKARLGWKGLKADEYIDEGYIFLSTPNIKGRIIDFDNVNYINEERYLESPEIMLELGDVLVAKDGSTLGITNVVRDLPAPATVNSSIAVLRPQKQIKSIFLYWLMVSNFTQSVIQKMKDGQGVPHLFQADLRKFWVWIPPFPEQTAIAAFLDRETALIDALIAKKQRLIELLTEKRSAVISHAVTKGLDPDAPMKDSGVEWLGEVPAHWEVSRLKFLLRNPLQYGANEPAELDDPGLPRYIRITDVAEDGSLRNETFRSLPEDIARPYLLAEGDVLLARSGATVGKSFIYKNSWGVAAYAGYLIRASINERRALADFIYLFTRTRAYWSYIDSSLIQATIQNVSAEKYANLWIPIPPTVEQKQIVSYLKGETAHIGALITKNQEAIAKLQEYRTALITAAVTGKIDVREEAANAAAPLHSYNDPTKGDKPCEKTPS